MTNSIGKMKIAIDAPFQPLAMFTGFPPTGSLLQSLIAICDDISSMDNLPHIQVRNILAMSQRIRFLSPLFKEVQEMNIPLLPSAILCFTELLSLIIRLKLLIQGCAEGSYLWSLIQTEFLSKEFNEIVKEIGEALDILPLKLMNITMDIREQVELLHKQANRADLLVDRKEKEIRGELLQMIAIIKERDHKNYNSLDVGKARDILGSIGLRCAVDFAAEISKLKVEAGRQAGTGGPKVVSSIHTLISFVSYVKSMVFSFEENQKTLQCLKQRTISNELNRSSALLAMLTDIPDDFRCPISLEIMREPVTIATGHTYDRDSITQWINSGHRTCPKSGYKLIHMALIPNYNLKSLIHQWLQDNNIPLNELTSFSSDLYRSNRMGVLCITAVRLTAEYLVGKLATASPKMQCRAAYEIRLLAKNSMNNRRIIAEAGATPFLVALLHSDEPAMQENAVTALLNLSIHTNNKFLIMEAASLERLIAVLQYGKTTKARENAAATISSLTIMDDYKATIGAEPRAITALVGLMREGATTGKRDAATALFNLASHNQNKSIIVLAGAVPLLIDILMDEKAGMTDYALMLLLSLLGCTEGVEDTRKSKDLVPVLIELLRFGSPKGRENSIMLLHVLSKDGEQEVVRYLDPQSYVILQSLAANGSSEAQRKAGVMLKLLIRCCSNPAMI